MQQRGPDNKRLYDKKILVAEDVELNQHLAKHILESRGAAVAIANNGHEALQLVRENFFDCVLMDVQMPEMDGIQATLCIRQLADPVKASVPIIALTANVLNEDIAKYRAAGMNDYLAKPFDEPGLLLVILRNQEPPAVGKNNSQQKSIEISVSQQPLYDLSLIQSMAGADAGFMKKMIKLFIDTVPQNVKELTTATKTENWEQVSKMAHKLKSTVDSMGKNQSGTIYDWLNQMRSIRIILRTFLRLLIK
jgi:CheY-like chemotaxis protein